MDRLIVALMLAGCGSTEAAAPEPTPVVQAVPPTQPEPRAMPSTPALPPGVWFQLHVLESDSRYQITKEGGWYTGVGDVLTKSPPITKGMPGAQVLSADSQRRVREALKAVDFFALPSKLDTPAPRGQTPEEPEASTWVFSARGDDGSVHTVTVSAIAANPSSMGALGPLFRVLDDEALGGWQNE